MLIKYFSPNFTFISLLKALFTPKAETKLVSYFQKYTGKEFIIVTNSCRSALYLAYKSIGKKGTVITNPLTCNVALGPIIASGNKVVYTDIEKDKLTMLTSDLHRLKTDDVFAVQANHLGGFFCNMGEISRFALKKGIYIIEDCAQGFLSSYAGIKPGDLSDVVCFSLIKNAYGIGGGILATDDPEIFRNASDLKRSFKKAPFNLILFRIVRNLLETYREIKLLNFLYLGLMNCRRLSRDFKNKGESSDYDTLPSNFEMKISYVQLTKAVELNRIRKLRAELLMKKLKEKGLIKNYTDVSGYDSTFTKFFMVNENIRSENIIRELNERGVEAKHLEQKFRHVYQERIDLSNRPELAANISECTNYFKLYERIISLPLTENMKEKAMDKMVRILNEFLSDEENSLV